MVGLLADPAFHLSPVPGGGLIGLLPDAERHHDAGAFRAGRASGDVAIAGAAIGGAAGLHLPVDDMQAMH